MALFSYRAKDKNGIVRAGSIKAISKQQARQILIKMNLKPLRINPNSDSIDAKLKQEKQKKIIGEFVTLDRNGKIQIRIFLPLKPTDKDIIIFTKQLSTMIGSGLALIQALTVLSQQQRVPKFGTVLDSVKHSIENGSSLSNALEQFPDTFDSLYVAMVRAGETSGKLDEILAKLVSYVEKASRIRSQIKSAMVYPVIVLFVAISVIYALLIFVVPTFAKQYSDSNQDLPPLTNYVIQTSNFLSDNWYLVILALIAGYYILRFYSKTSNGREKIDKWLLQMPVLGDLIRKVSVGRFCNTMATMLSSGINLLEALNICAASAGNKSVEAFILGVRGKIERGAKISDPLGDGTLFPPMVVSMVAVGEATGALDQMLQKVSEFYEEEVDLAVKTMLALVEPVMIITIGGIVGIIVIAMYLPVFDMANLVTN